MLRLLLDEHISPGVAAGLRRRHPGLVIRAFAEWEGGNFLGQDDAACLAAALVQGLTRVTYDRRTIPPLLKRWAAEARTHAGVIFVDERTISPADIGVLVLALGALVEATRTWDWNDRITVLRRSTPARS